MSKTKKLVAIAILSLLMVGCSATAAGDDNREYLDSRTHVIVVTLPDDDTVDCVINPVGGGITCDWATRG